MLPIKDNVPTRTFPVVTVALIAANIAIWLWEVQGGVNDEVLRSHRFADGLWSTIDGWLERHGLRG